jgi:hypothetical protein
VTASSFWDTRLFLRALKSLFRTLNVPLLDVVPGCGKAAPGSDSVEQFGEERRDRNARILHLENFGRSPDQLTPLSDALVAYALPG